VLLRITVLEAPFIERVKRYSVLFSPTKVMGGSEMGIRLTDALKSLLREVKAFFLGMHQAMIEQSVEVLEVEYLELEHAFLTMVLGNLVGLPLAPLSIAAELAPLLEDETKILFSRTWRGADSIADLFSTMGGEW